MIVVEARRVAESGVLISIGGVVSVRCTHYITWVTKHVFRTFGPVLSWIEFDLRTVESIDTLGRAELLNLLAHVNTLGVTVVIRHRLSPTWLDTGHGGHGLLPVEPDNSGVDYVTCMAPRRRARRRTTAGGRHSHSRSPQVPARPRGR